MYQNISFNNIHILFFVIKIQLAFFQVETEILNKIGVNVMCQRQKKRNLIPPSPSELNIPFYERSNTNWFWGYVLTYCTKNILRIYRKRARNSSPHTQM